MSYRIACQCGKGVFAELPDAGGEMPCVCGRTVTVPTRTQLQETQPYARRVPPPRARLIETESARTISSAKWWFAAGVIFLMLGVMLKGGECVDLFGVGLMTLGAVRLARGLVQRRDEVQAG